MSSLSAEKTEIVYGRNDGFCIKLHHSNGRQTILLISGRPDSALQNSEKPWEILGFEKKRWKKPYKTGEKSDLYNKR